MPANALAAKLVSIVWIFGKYMLYLLPVFVFLGIIAFIVRQRILYPYPVRVFKTRENRKVLEKNYKGGFINRKNAAPFFRIKFGPFWWQHKDMNSTPETQYMDEQNRVYYRQTDIDTFIQQAREFSNPVKVKFKEDHREYKEGDVVKMSEEKAKGLEEEGKVDLVHGGKVKFSPVDSDVKYGAILDIQKIRDVTKAKNRMMQYVGWGVLGLLATIHLVVVLVVLKGG